MSRILALLGIAIILGACAEDNRGFGEASDRVSGGLTGDPAPLVDPEGPPPASCIDSIAGNVRLIETAGLLPEDARANPRPHERGWVPVLLADMVAAPDGIWVVDELDGRIIRFSHDLGTREIRIRKGEGPNEVIRPAALALASDGQRLAIVDRGSGLLKLFTTDGTLDTSHRLPYPSEDVAIAQDGTIYVSHVVVALPEYGSREQVAVSVLAPGDVDFHPFLTITGEGLVPPRFPVRGPTRVRLSVGPEQVAAWYPVSGVVDVFSHAAERVTQVEACLPADIAEFYATQRQSEENSSYTFDLITDVRIDDAGGIELIGPQPDQRGQYHIDTFSADGRPLGSLVDRTPGIELPDQVRFLAPGSLGGFTRNGVVGTIRVERF